MQENMLCAAGCPAGVDREELDQQVQQDQARMLYANSWGGYCVATLASLSLVSMIETPANLPRLQYWLGAMAAVLALRIIDLYLLHPRRTRSSWPGRTEIGFYGAGLGSCAVIWAIFPLLFFQGADPAARAGTAIVLAALAGCGPAGLGTVRRISISYCLCLLLPFSFMFLLLPGRSNTILGLLGIMDAAIMTAACLVMHRRMTNSIRLARANQMLTAASVAQQCQMAVANAQLRAAQVALHESNRTLETRIEERTADLKHEICEREGYARALGRLASNDALTGLFNRGTLTQRLASILEERRHGCTGDNPSIQAAVLFLDLDGFKQINDVQGHCTGDHVLRVVASRLRAHGGEGVDVARWGGDEFVIVMARPSRAAEILALANDIQERLTDPIDTGPRSIRVGATIGIALYPDHGASPDELIRAADLAMYAAKREGGKKIRMFDRLLADAVVERHVLEQGLRNALEDGQLSIHYQPIVDSVSGRCDIMEALLRWTHPDRGPISPVVFIPIAEQSGQIGAIGRFVLKQACCAALTWPGFDPPAVAVNISAAQILSGQLLDDVQAALDFSGLPVHRLHLEITESMFMADHARIMPVLDELRSRGIHLALDDFGTGFSSLARLKNLPINTIKIDKDFVQAGSQESSAIIRAMLLIARAMQLDVTAEGVETEQQLAMLANFGATRVQGYLLARPMHAGLVSEWLSSREFSRQRRIEAPLALQAGD